MTVRLPTVLYAPFKRLVWRWVHSATFHGGWVRVELRRRERR